MNVSRTATEVRMLDSLFGEQKPESFGDFVAMLGYLVAKRLGLIGVLTEYCGGDE